MTDVAEQIEMLSRAALATRPAEHPAWERLTDGQRHAINELWDHLCEPALARGEEADRRMADARLVEQDAAARVHYLETRGGFAALHMPVHDPSYGCCLHGADVGDLCACRIRGARLEAHSAAS